jgi:hypothetical protein
MHFRTMAQQFMYLWGSEGHVLGVCQKRESAHQTQYEMTELIARVCSPQSAFIE